MRLRVGIALPMMFVTACVGEIRAPASVSDDEGAPADALGDAIGDEDGDAVVGDDDGDAGGVADGSDDAGDAGDGDGAGGDDVGDAGGGDDGDTLPGPELPPGCYEEDLRVVCDGPVLPDDAKFVGVFRADEGASKYVLGVTRESLEAIALALAYDSTWRLVDLDTAHSADGTRVFSAVFRQRVGGHDWVFDASWNDVQDAVTNHAAVGQRVVDVLSYVDDGVRRFAAVFNEGDGLDVLSGGDATSFASQREALSAAGLALTGISVNADDGVPYYVGIWQNRGATSHLVDTEWDAFASAVVTTSAGALRPADIAAYLNDGQRLYAGTFEPASGAYAVLSASSPEVLASEAARYASGGRRLTRLVADFGVDQPPLGFAAAFHTTIDPQAVGYSFAFMNNGVLVSSGGRGYARAPAESVWPNTRMTATKRMTIASVSKPITAVSLLHLFEEEGLSIDTPFYDYVEDDFPTIAAGVDTILVRDLMNHRTGMVSWGGCGPVLHDSMASLMQTALAGTPGVTQAYSNGNLCLARLVIEAVSGEPYIAYVQQHILAPMGITGMSCTPAAVAPTLYYRGDNHSLPGVYFGDYAAECGAYGWEASALDLVKFSEGVRQNVVISEATKQDAFASQLGFWGYDTNAGVAYQHSGAWLTGDGRGYNGAIELLPGGTNAVLLVNTMNDSYFSVVWTLATGFDNMP